MFFTMNVMIETKWSMKCFIWVATWNTAWANCCEQEGITLSPIATVNREKNFDSWKLYIVPWLAGRMVGKHIFGTANCCDEPDRKQVETILLKRAFRAHLVPGRGALRSGLWKINFFAARSTILIWIFWGLGRHLAAISRSRRHGKFFGRYHRIELGSGYNLIWDTGIFFVLAGRIRRHSAAIFGFLGGRFLQK